MCPQQRTHFILSLSYKKETGRPTILQGLPDLYSEKKIGNLLIKRAKEKSFD